MGGALSRHAPLDSSALTSSNGMTTNGMTTNGMTTNGLTTNGLALAGLSVATLSTSQFATWFASDPYYASMLMTYVVKCALPAGISFPYVSNGVTYWFTGELGLAPVWVSGAAIPVAEQQLVSACLGAHVNKFGVHVAVSVRGYQTSGLLIPVAATEQNQYPLDEGCFFGNLFDGTGVFTAYSGNSPLAQAGKTSERACAANDGKPGNCAPMTATGKTCQSICTGQISAITGAFEYQSCSWKGVTYPALTIRLQSADVATCGDGICAASESCYSWTNGQGCQADCGKCAN
jgi:hypothetical protein